MKTVQELPYAIVNFICPFTVYAIIQFQRIRHSKNLYIQKFHFGKWEFQKREMPISLMPNISFKTVNLDNANHPLKEYRRA
jgi:hypothetical protein